MGRSGQNWPNENWTVAKLRPGINMSRELEGCTTVPKCRYHNASCRLPKISPAGDKNGRPLQVIKMTIHVIRMTGQGVTPEHRSRGIAYLLSKLNTINTSHIPGIRHQLFLTQKRLHSVHPSWLKRRREELWPTPRCTLFTLQVL
jgi:hypothetical protein